MVESALPEAGHLARPVDRRGQGAELRAIVPLATFVCQGVVAILLLACLPRRRAPTSGLRCAFDDPQMWPVSRDDLAAAVAAVAANPINLASSTS